MDIKTAEAILDYEEPIHYVVVQDEKIINQSRWDTSYAAVYRDTRDDTFWEISWDRGSTEMQDFGPEFISVRQVTPKIVSQTIYVALEEGVTSE